jgi:hypothetical protein
MLFTKGGRGHQAGHGDVSYKAIQCVGWEELHFQKIPHQNMFWCQAKSQHKP